MTVLESLAQSLPPSYVLSIIQNIEEKNILDEEHIGSIALEIETIFNWSVSYEGFDFWCNVVESIKNNEELPKLPVRIKWNPDTFICLSDELLGDEFYLMNFKGKKTNLLIDSIDLQERPRNKTELLFREKYYSFCN